MKKRFLAGFMVLIFSFMPCMEARAMMVGADTAEEANVLALGNGSAAVIDANGSLWTWGNNEYGQLGNGTQKDSAVPVKVMDNVKSVYMKESTTAALKKDGSLWIWGENFYGNLGNGTDTYCSLVPVKVLNNVKSYYPSAGTPAALKTDGSLWMWGSNYYGSLGNGTTKSTNAPIKVMDHVKSVSLDDRGAVAAVKTDGSLWMWGRNDCGQLGNGTTVGSSIPIKIMDGVKSVKANLLTTAVIKEDDSLWMWGWNDYGNLGNGTTEESNVPIKVMEDVKEVNLNKAYSYAIKKDDSLWIWGNNMMQVLYNGSKRLTQPCKIMENVKSGFGNHHTAVLIKEDNSLWTWGNNARGHLGLGLSELVYYQPTKVMDDVEVICQSDNNGDKIVTAVIKEDGSLWMWGWNEFGQLGNGTTTDSTVPIKTMDHVALPGSLTFDNSVQYKKIPAKNTILEVPVNDEKVVFEAYSIENNNYVKLRDVAMALSGTEKQFNVTWDNNKKAINMITGASYVAIGTELSLQKELTQQNFSNMVYTPKFQNASENTAKIYLDGTAVNMKAYIIDGNTYFKLRDLGNVIDFYVGWDTETGTVTLDTSKGYSV